MDALTQRDVLSRILERKAHEVRIARNAVPLDALRRAAAFAPAARDLGAALDRGPGVSLIAEIKRASPRGVFAPDLSARRMAEVYASAGAAAISVLTDRTFFHGSVDDLAAARAATDLPILRKDFLIDPYQVWEARAHGADAVLLVARAVERERLADLLELSHDLGMEALVEVHGEDELAKLDGLPYRILGINNRNLATFEVDLDTTRRVAAKAPSGVLVVSESGIKTRADVETVARAGARAILVGESLVTAEDPAARIAELLGTLAAT